ncbi:M20 family metallopeptidase [Fundidesulfovibrio butyratiphilus]
MASGSFPCVDVLELTRRFVRAKSVNPPGDTGHVAALAARTLQPAGFTLTWVRTPGGGQSLLAVLKGSGERPPLCLTGHMDTVPLGQAAWSVDPFGAEVRLGRLYGRGASDMKAGLAVIVAAAVDLAELADRSGDLVLALTADEEIGCLGARALAASGLLPERAGALLVAEPTGCRPLLGHKGAFWVRAAFAGKTAHGSMPQCGVNAVGKAVAAAARLPELLAEEPAHPLLGSPTVNLGSLHGGDKVNMVPDLATLELDVRTVPPMDHARLMDKLRALWPEARLDAFIDVPPVLTDPTDPLVTRVQDTLESLEGQRPAPGVVSFFTDASVLTRALGDAPTVIYGPGESEQAHQTDESCPVEHIERALRFYLAFGTRWLTGEGN